MSSPPEHQHQPEEIARAARIFKALSHPGRLELACRLARGPASQKDLVAATGLPQSSVARLLLPLRELDLIAAAGRGPSGEIALSASSRVIGDLVSTVCDWLHGERSAPAGQEGRG
ncbi:helix-turn-helix domain-containing protein [bacterium]|nr:helix-turn-helix domain-containing protein [bacterium]